MGIRTDNNRVKDSAAMTLKLVLILKIQYKKRGSTHSLIILLITGASLKALGILNALNVVNTYNSVCNTNAGKNSLYILSGMVNIHPRILKFGRIALRKETSSTATGDSELCCSSYMSWERKNEEITLLEMKTSADVTRIDQL